MTAKRHAADAKADRPEFPKPLVRLRPEVGGYGAEVRMVADGDAETGATAEGFEALSNPPQPLAFQDYPKWLYHADGRRQIVASEAEGEALGGDWAETPAPPPEPKAGAAVAGASKHPPHADRG